LSISGHAFEARLYAEDVPAGFLPATGVLEHLRFGTARVDTGVRQGDEISTYYDPMIAKLTVHGASREAALATLDQALAGTQIAGTVTNIAFLKALGRHAGFVAGDVDTGLIGRDIEALTVAPVPCTRCRAIAAVTALGVLGDGFALWQPLRHFVTMENGGEVSEAWVSVVGDGAFDVALGADRHEVKLTDKRWSVDGATVAAEAVRTRAGVSVFWGNTYHFNVADPLDRTSDAGGDDETRAPMPGVVKAVYVATGDRVAAGDRLAVLEAMKMEHSLVAHRDGVIASVGASEGAQVSAGDLLVALVAE
jgi:3-methylcrotonyl-CoA carboxylase alpha subunit